MDNNQQAYNIWAHQYDTNKNKTRDLEGMALRQVLSHISYENALEIGCGTGKNSEWLMTQAERVVAVDFSDEMLNKAKEKVKSGNIQFQKADITEGWSFTDQMFDLISFSLVLEHIQDLDFIFKQIQTKLRAGGHVYIGELHPFKQYQGSLARFDTEGGRMELDCYTHNISEFLGLAKTYGLTLIELEEWFDEDDKTSVPRILTLLFQAI